MDQITEVTGWPTWQAQVKKVALIMAVIMAAGALYSQLNRDYGFKEHINGELQRGYGSNGGMNNAALLGDYTDVARGPGADSGDMQRDGPVVSVAHKSSSKAEGDIVWAPVSSPSSASGFSIIVDDAHNVASHEEEESKSLPEPVAPPSTEPSLAPTRSMARLQAHSVSSSASSSSQPLIENKDSTKGFIGVQTHPMATETSQREPSRSNPKNKEAKWPLSELELSLFAAKEAINNAPLTTSSAYAKLHAPIYHNLSQFIKSYELMEHMFRVYVYEEGRDPLVHSGPVFGIYSSEGLFIRQMEVSKQFRVSNASDALAFLLPYSVANMVDELYVPPSTSMLPLSTFIKSYVNVIATRHPFWDRTRGGDHFFVSCHDWGLMTTYEHEELRRNTMKVLCNADKTTEYVETRDASLPEFYMHETEKLDDNGKAEEERPAHRDTLAFFAGQMHGRVRPKLLQYWEYPKGGEEMQVYGVLPHEAAHRMSYEQRMRTSRYCLCPMGYEVNSPRVVEAIQAMCVPVIVADGFVLPFSDVLKWSTFSVTVLERDLPSLKSILQGIPEHAYLSMQSRLRHVRRHFTWHTTPQPFDTFHMILHSVWTRRLFNITTSLQI